MKTYRKYLEEKNYRPSTVRAYYREYEKFIAWLDTENLDVQQVDYKNLLQLIRHCRAEGRSRNEVSKQLLGARLYYNYLIDQGIVTDNPVIGLGMRGNIRRIPHDLIEWEVLEQIYQDYEVTSPITQRNKVVLGLLIYQALNIEEIEKLETSHFKLQEGKIHVPAGPRSNGRTLSLEATQILGLQEYEKVTREILLKNARNSHFDIGKRRIETLFFGAGGGRMEASLWYFLKGIDKSLKAKKIRCSVIAHWLKTKDIRVVQYMAGHKYVSSTERYLKVRLEDLQQALDKFHPFNRNNQQSS